jgi:DNA-directed RNA polymerase specialized sigma24 family protein
MLCLVEVADIVKEGSTPSVDDDDGDIELVKRRKGLADRYDALPAYGSVAYWKEIEACVEEALPLELLVRCVREAMGREDDIGRKRLFEVIFRRTHSANEYWANNVIKTMNLRVEEQSVLVGDLYADLCECVMRALIDRDRLFWEESFQHCLSFERRHVFRTFMTREGRWNSEAKKKTARIPRALVDSLDQPRQQSTGDLIEVHIEDETAQRDLLAVEHSDLPRLILDLPDKLKAVVLLIFWEGRTEKDTAMVLGITDRTVRNRLRDALEILRHKLEPEREVLYG